MAATLSLAVRDGKGQRSAARARQGGGRQTIRPHVFSPASLPRAPSLHPLFPPPFMPRSRGVVRLRAPVVRSSRWRTWAAAIVCLAAALPRNRAVDVNSRRTPEPWRAMTRASPDSLLRLQNSCQKTSKLWRAPLGAQGRPRCNMWRNGRTGLQEAVLVDRGAAPGGSRRLAANVRRTPPGHRCPLQPVASRRAAAPDPTSYPTTTREPDRSRSRGDSPSRSDVHASRR